MPQPKNQAASVRRLKDAQLNLAGGCFELFELFGYNDARGRHGQFAPIHLADGVEHHLGLRAGQFTQVSLYGDRKSVV